MKGDDKCPVCQYEFLEDSEGRKKWRYGVDENAAQFLIYYLKTEMYGDGDGNEITMIVCPKCKSTRVE